MTIDSADCGAAGRLPLGRAPVTGRDWSTNRPRARPAAGDRPLDVLVARRSGARPGARARPARPAGAASRQRASRSGLGDGDALVPLPAGRGTYCDLLARDPLAHDLAGDLADQEVVGRDLAADDGQPEPPAGVDRDHARVAADRVAGEHHSRDRGVDHQLHGHAHRRALRRAAELRAVGDRLRRCTGSPSSRGPRRRPRRRRAPTGRCPAGRRTWPPATVLADRARAHRHRGLGHAGAAASCSYRARPRPRSRPARRPRDRLAIDRAAAAIASTSSGGTPARASAIRSSAAARRNSRTPRCQGEPRAAPGSRRAAARRGWRSCRRTAARRCGAARASAAGVPTGSGCSDRHRPRRAGSPRPPSRRRGSSGRCGSARWPGRCRRRPAARTRGTRSRRGT